MKFPIILQADGGITWWPTVELLQNSLESPDLKAGIHAVWDAEGQILGLTVAHPVSRSSFSGIPTVSISPGVLIESGKYEPDQLRSAVVAHLQPAHLSSEKIASEDLDSIPARL